MKRYVMNILMMLLVCFALCSCKTTEERDDKDDNSNTTIETEKSESKDKDINKNEDGISEDDKATKTPDNNSLEDEKTTETPDDNLSKDDETPIETPDTNQSEEEKNKSLEEDKKIQELIEKYRDDFDSISDEEYSSICDWVDFYNGYFANEEGTITISITNYSDYYGSFAFGIGNIKAFGYKLDGEWEICGKNKARLVGVEDWESRDDEYNSSALDLMNNEIVVDFSAYGTDKSITVKINDELEFKCNKVINYFGA